MCSNLTNKYNPQERIGIGLTSGTGSNLTNKYNPQEQWIDVSCRPKCSNLTNKYNPQERIMFACPIYSVQILPINTILKNIATVCYQRNIVQILPINTILKNHRPSRF